MNISPANISIPVMASSVNPTTEQAERDNKLRAQIAPTKQVDATEAETAVSVEHRRQELTERLTYDAQPKKKAKKNNNRKSFAKDEEASEQNFVQKPVKTEKPALTKVQEKTNNSQNQDIVIAKCYQKFVDPDVSLDLDIEA